jgi:hypothetical protein
LNLKVRIDGSGLGVERVADRQAIERVIASPDGHVR